MAVSPLRPFKPRSWLRNRHFQSIYPSLPLQSRLMRRRAAPLLAASTPMLLDCGDGVQLAAFHGAPARPNGRLVVLLHGWEGSAESAYILSLGQDLFNEQAEVVRLNLRDHGDTQHLNRGLFHSCLLPEVAGAVGEIVRRFPGRELWLVGFSLGGNFMLRVAALPESALLSRSLRRKQALWPDDHDFGALLRLADLRRMTAELVVRNTHFTRLEDYLQGYAITGRRLETLAAPAVILTSEDDPIIPAEDVARLAAVPQLRVHVTPHGGHTGFLERVGRPSWANHFILETMASVRRG